PTFTDSGGFQVMSLGSGFKKVISMEATGQRSDELVAVGKERLSNVDDDGVTFKSHLDGAMHRFTPEISMRVQHEIGADIMLPFRRPPARAVGPYPSLSGLLPAAQSEALRRKAARDLGGLDFDGFGIGGALKTVYLGSIMRWVCEKQPGDTPRHLWRISEPDD